MTTKTTSEYRVVRTDTGCLRLERNGSCFNLGLFSEVDDLRQEVVELLAAFDKPVLIHTGSGELIPEGQLKRAQEALRQHKARNPHLK